MNDKDTDKEIELTTGPVLTLGLPTQTATQAIEDIKADIEKTEIAVPGTKDLGQVPEYKLSEAEQKMVDDFAKTIDITDSQVAITYGAAAQKNISNFSENTLNSVKSKDLGDVGDSLAELVGALKGFNVQEKKGIAGWFQKKKSDLDTLRASYDSAAVNIDKIVARLETHQVGLMKDIALLDKLYELNEQYLRELTMYIVAGKQALERVKSVDLENLRIKAAESGLPEDAQAYNDMVNMCNRFEKRLHDLELTRIVSIQMGPQTRLIQNNDAMILEKIQSSIANTIPLWKSQIVLALGMENSRQATSAVSAVTDMTNELLKRNADTLKMGTVEVARESERSIVSVEALKHANEQLIASIDEVMRIQSEGAQKRKEAEAELGRIEGELKQKLLEIKGGN